MYVATRAVEGDPTPPELFKHLTGNTSWCNLTSGVAILYRRAGGFPRQVAAAPESSGVTTLYVAMAGEGVLTVSDDTGDCAP